LAIQVISSAKSSELINWFETWTPTPVLSNILTRSFMRIENNVGDKTHRCWANHRELLEKIGDSRTMSLLYRVSVLYKKRRKRIPISPFLTCRKLSTECPVIIQLK
jgi:hypothetical protein